ncbi:hypothetical protein ACFSHT_09955 [Paraburkholderia silviterrae]|uniref:Glycosyl transferase family 9 (Putative heptosyltransferase) n=1 Tax=Paraburkholderia silviterrae TaxID=2528715 RepID=A0A4R5MDV5_9BURK|nr:hypothetical protein [Paraburkholderia silviterrae]TDG25286.1 hypothetical protein EYW47_05445 [Paraburkholderia silviterrae]
MSHDPEQQLLKAFVAHTRSPSDPAPLLQICEALVRVKRDEQMLPWAEKGLALDPRNRAFVHARARALRLLGRHAQAVQTWLDFAPLDWSPLFYQARLGRDLYLSGDTAGAVALLERALLNPAEDDDADKLRVHKWLAEALLSTGDARGFKHWIWRNLGDSGNYRYSAVPMWDGQRDLRGERVLVTHQMGYGDQFMLYGSIRQWRAAGAEVMVTCDAVIHSVIAASLPDLRVVAARRPMVRRSPIDAETLPAVQAFAPTLQATLLHLPMLAACDQPRPEPFFEAYIRAPVAAHGHAASWANALRAQHPGKALVGVFWDCSQRHARELSNKDRSWAGLRSLPLEALERLTTDPQLTSRVHFVSLHHPVAEIMGGSPRGNISHYAPGIMTFGDTAACIAHLDAAISVDSGVANLAVMSGKPTAVLVNPAGEWRWGSNGMRSPWMRDAHVLRQATMGDWDAVVSRAAQWLLQR